MDTNDLVEGKEQTRVNPYPVRMNIDLKTRLEQSAKDNSRSLNVEIIKRLESSFSPVVDGAESGNKTARHRESMPELFDLAIQKIVPLHTAWAMNKNYTQEIAAAFFDLADMIESGQSDPRKIEWHKESVNNRLMLVMRDHE